MNGRWRRPSWSSGLNERFRGQLSRLPMNVHGRDGDSESADERFSAAVEAGRKAALGGIIEPDMAEALLSEMEERLPT